MSEIKALSAALDADLRPVSLYLWQQRVPHRVSEHAGQQVIWVASEEAVERVREAHELWRQGRLRLTPSDAPPPRPVAPATSPAPLTLGLLALSVLGFLVALLDDQLHLLSTLTFFAFDRHGDAWLFSLPRGEYWRLLTPIFLHFSLLHIVFNGLWLWDLGRRVEHGQGTWRLLGLVLLIGVGSNLAQAVFARAGVFGGMSGVIYGLLGYCWIWTRLSGESTLAVPNVVMGLMLGWLVLCMTGFSELLGVGAVANAAHVGGLLMGLLLGAGGVWLRGARA